MNLFHIAGIELRFGPRVFFVLSLCFAAATIAGCKGEPDSTERAISWTSIDGVAMHGRIYSGPAESPSGLLLVHDIGGQHTDWETFARQMELNGFRSLAFDMRGHAQSTQIGDVQLQFGAFTAPDWAMAQDDLLAAKSKLIESGADPDNLFIVGSGLGGSLAARHAVNDPDIQGVVILSPLRKTQGISIEKAIAENRRLPLLLIAAEGDTYSASSAEALKESSDAYCETRIYRGSMQGVDIIANNGSVSADIVEWISPILK